MPWSNQSGNGGGPWKPNNPGPWGQGPSGGPSGGGGPPDLEKLLRRGQDRLRQAMPGGSFGGRGIAIGAGLLLLGWLATGFYTVRPDEVGINMIFGRYVGKTGEGLRYNLPYPIGTVVKPRVTTVNKTEIGYRSTGAGAGRGRDVLEESLVLTGDENIVDVDFDVQWQIEPARAENFVFNLQNPEGTIKSVAESAMREVLGRRNIQQILTTDRVAVEAEVLQLMQDTLNSYGAGVTVRLVQLLKVDPPAQVIEAFRDVQAAQQDQSRARNEAETYASRVVPEARGQAARVVQEAEAYRERSVAEATGNASRFTQVYEEYRKAPDVTRQRLFLETMERVLGGMNKVIIDNNGRGDANGNGGGQGVLPVLPLDQLIRRNPTPAQSGVVQGQTR